MKITILGPGCRNCVTLERLAREAAADLGIDAEIVKVTDYAEIASYGIMSTPGLVLDGDVVLSGRLPEAPEVRELIAARAG
jgi:small redox-active disulfide protein 2